MLQPWADSSRDSWAGLLARELLGPVGRDSLQQTLLLLPRAQRRLGWRLPQSTSHYFSRAPCTPAGVVSTGDFISQPVFTSRTPRYSWQASFWNGHAPVLLAGVVSAESTPPYSWQVSFHGIAPPCAWQTSFLWMELQEY